MLGSGPELISGISVLWVLCHHAVCNDAVEDGALYNDVINDEEYDSITFSELSLGPLFPHPLLGFSSLLSTSPLNKTICNFNDGVAFRVKRCTGVLFLLASIIMTLSSYSSSTLSHCTSCSYNALTDSITELFDGCTKCFKLESVSLIRSSLLYFWCK